MYEFLQNSQSKKKKSQGVVEVEATRRNLEMVEISMYVLFNGGWRNGPQTFAEMLVSITSASNVIKLFISAINT
jgi:hypothetical protein